MRLYSLDAGEETDTLNACPRQEAEVGEDHCSVFPHSSFLELVISPPLSVSYHNFFCCNLFQPFLFSVLSSQLAWLVVWSRQYPLGTRKMNRGEDPRWRGKVLLTQELFNLSNT